MVAGRKWVWEGWIRYNVWSHKVRLIGSTDDFVNVGPCILVPSPRTSLIPRQQLHGITFSTKRQSYLNFQRLVGGSVESTHRTRSAAHISRSNRTLPPPQKASNAGTTRLPDNVTRGTTRSVSPAARPTLGAESELGHWGNVGIPGNATENLTDGRWAATGRPPDRGGERCVSFPDVPIRCAGAQARLRRVERFYIWHRLFGPECATIRSCRGLLEHATGARRAREGVNRRSAGRREE